MQPETQVGDQRFPLRAFRLKLPSILDDRFPVPILGWIVVGTAVTERLCIA